MGNLQPISPIIYFKAVTTIWEVNMMEPNHPFITITVFGSSNPILTVDGGQSFDRVGVQAAIFHGAFEFEVLEVDLREPPA
jgi:hypothetical protein